MKIFNYTAGTLPLLVSVPHAGTYVPPDISERLSDAAKATPDTDWHVEKLYDFVPSLGAHMIAATHSRYVVDLNRDPDGETLYPGRFNSGLCPVETFHREAIYNDKTPDADEIKLRVATYWQPYHDKIKSVLAEIFKTHGRALLFDAHSIESRVPALFEGELPTLNLGTADGKSCRHELAEIAAECCKKSGYSFVVNGRFKGGYITRHYGQPEANISAIQLEIAQSSYMKDGDQYSYVVTPSNDGVRMPSFDGMTDGVESNTKCDPDRLKNFLHTLLENLLRVE